MWRVPLAVAIIAVVSIAGCIEDPSGPPLDLSEIPEGGGEESSSDSNTESKLDQGHLVQRIAVSSLPENVDGDAPAELRVQVAGLGHDDYEHYRFAGLMNFTLERNAGDSFDENWVIVHEGSARIAASDFDSEFLPTFEAVVDDNHVIDDEEYRLSLIVTLDSSGQTFHDVKERTFWDEAEDQEPPARNYTDSGTEIQRISLYAYAENLDGDHAEELEVSVRGEDRDAEPRRFAASAIIIIERDDGDWEASQWTEVGRWTVGFTQNNFTGQYSPEYVYVVDDHLLEPVDSFEEYRVTVEVTVEATGQVLSDRDDFYYSTD